MMLNDICRDVIARAQRQGHVDRHEICAELVRARLPEARWRDVVAAAQPHLRDQNGRYYYSPPTVARLRARVREETQEARQAKHSIRLLIEEAKAKPSVLERRAHERVPFLQPVEILTPDGHTLRFLSQDISLTGIQLIGNCSLLGQKVRVRISRVSRSPVTIVLLVLWAAEAGDGLVQQGGVFVGEPISKSKRKGCQGRVAPRRPRKEAGPRVLDAGGPV
jgi:hypothetical protein